MIFSVNITDDADDYLDCDINVNGFVEDSFQAFNSNITNRPVIFAEGGLKFWNVSCTDDAGNYNISVTRNFTLAFPPKVNLTSPPANWWFNSSDIVLYYNATDDNDNIANSTLILNGLLNISNQSEIIPGQINNYSLNLSDGKYNWTVNVTDKTNLQGTDTLRVFYVDTQKPKITLNYPQQLDVLDWNNFSFNFSVIDNLDLNLTCNLSLNDYVEFPDIAVQNGSNSLHNIERQDGNYTWFVYCWDDANNFNTSAIFNFTMEAPPRVNLTSPENGKWTQNQDITFSYIPDDPNNIGKCDLYIDSVFNDTDDAIDLGITNNFPVTGISEGKHNWTVECTDADLNIYAPTEWNFTIDYTPPFVNLTSPQDGDSFDYNDGFVKFNFSVIDFLSENLTCNLTLDNQVNISNFNVTNSTIENRTVYNIGQGVHYWNVTCIDLAGNKNTSETRNFSVFLPDFSINTSGIYFNVTNPKEGEIILINATIYNLGDVDSTGVIVQFYSGDPDLGGNQINGNKTLNISAKSLETTQIQWNASLGTSEIFVVVDPPTLTNGEFSELNETNNKASKNVTVESWHYFYGNLSEDSKFALQNNFSDSVMTWLSGNIKNGSIYVADSESIISWTELEAVGKNISGENTTNDFSDIDVLLNMNSYSDSVSSVFTLDGNTPKNTTSITVFKIPVIQVPIAESINNSNFFTGILWDKSDDLSNDGEYSQGDKEDLVFVTKINNNKQGAYGVYDYELRVPARLREYINLNSESASFYAEIN